MTSTALLHPPGSYILFPSLLSLQGQSVTKSPRCTTDTSPSLGLSLSPDGPDLGPLAKAELIREAVRSDFCGCPPACLPASSPLPPPSSRKETCV